MSRAADPSASPSLLPVVPTAPKTSPWTWPLAAAWCTAALLKLVPWLRGTISPPTMVASVAIAEAVVGLALFVPITRRVASAASGVLAVLLLIGGSLPVAWVTALEHQCGCLGPKLHLELAERRALASLLLFASCLALRGVTRKLDPMAASPSAA